MKNQRPFPAPFTVAAALLIFSTPMSMRAQAQVPALTPDQIEAIREQLGELRAVLEGRFSELNRSAGEVFKRAAQDPKTAVELYAKCYREVNFTRQGREDEYRAWEDQQKNNFKDPRFIEGIMVQLRYLALSCDAAEAEKLDDVFPALLAHVESLTSLNEVPSQQVLQGVNQSVFAQAYKLDELLARNKQWEMVPFDIPGIYEKTVLPHLRRNDPSRLIAAWDRRIAQQTQMAKFISSLEERGGNRDDRKASEAKARQLQDGRAGNVVRQYNANEFQERTLPMLQWARLRDLARYVDQVQGVAGLLAFLKENTEHPRAADWLDDLQSLLSELASGAPEGGGTTSVPASVGAPPAAAPAAATPRAPGTPLGLE
jgi:hypothetical protein